MKIVKLMGGLGNQMQQYALYEKFKSLGEEVYLDTSWFHNEKVQQNALAPRKLELDYFQNIAYETPTKEQIKQLIGDDSIASKIKRKLIPSSDKHFYETEMYHSEIFVKENSNLYLEGYWAAEKYYADILPILRERLVFQDIDEANQKQAEQIRSSAYPVSIHIRRGDYLDPENIKLFGNICTEAYYAGAINFMKEKHPEAEFYIFSDDEDYVKTTYASPEYHSVAINHGQKSYYDIWLMSQCKAHICANSTFSFWGARLNPTEEKTMIRPWIHKNTQAYDGKLMHDLWAEWILMDNQGSLMV